MTFRERIISYMVFTKFFLSLEVEISAILGYFFVAQGDWKWSDLILLFIGGSFLTAAAIGSNQIWERNTDKLMDRTKNRPLPSGRMSLREGYIIVLSFLAISLTCLWFLGWNVFWVSLLSFVLYSFVYTPMKRKSTLASFVGAIPGAFPPLIGAVAYANTFNFETGLMFFIQFIWQFPHFWAIAWKHDDSYKQGGFSLLPSHTGKTKTSAMIILIYTFFLIPFTIIPWVVGLTGIWSLIIGGTLSVFFFLTTVKLYIKLSVTMARVTMMASVLYLPIVQLVLVLDKCPAGGCSSLFGF